MSGYCKLFSDIVESSIWDAPPTTCKVWVTLLALSDQHGYVRGSAGWLASKARVSRDECDTAIEALCAPDASSRTPDYEGRRVELLADGFLVLNYIAFRDRLSSDPVAVATRDRVRKHRERYIALRNAASVTSAVSASVDASVDASPSDEGEGVKGKGGAAIGTARAKTFKTWTVADLQASVTEANADNLLTQDEVADFVSYWSEPTASGRLKVATMPTWDTRRRMQTAVRMVFSKQRAGGQPAAKNPHRSNLINVWHNPNPDKEARSAF